MLIISREGMEEPIIKTNNFSKLGQSLIILFKRDQINNLVCLKYLF